MLTCELRDAWALALESGEYKQGQSHLQMGERYCCLGVLCEVAGIEKRPHELREAVFEYAVPNDDDHDWTDGNIPNEIAGLSGDDCNRFVGMNDDAKLTFVQIAKEVRALSCLPAEGG